MEGLARLARKPMANNESIMLDRHGIGPLLAAHKTGAGRAF